MRRREFIAFISGAAAESRFEYVVKEVQHRSPFLARRPYRAEKCPSSEVQADVG